MKITVYTITDCPFCKQEKDFLNAQGLQFEEKNVQENRDFLTEMLEKSNKFAGVPFTIVEKDGGEKVNLKGFTQSEFEQALGLSPAGSVAAPAAVPTPSVDPVVAPMSTPTDMPAANPASPVAPATPTLDPTVVASSMPDAAQNMPSMPGIDEAPAMPAAPVMSVESSAPSMPAEPAAPATPTTSPTEVTPANPQNQLDGLLADLQTKSQPDLPDFNAPAAPVSSDTASQQQ